MNILVTGGTGTVGSQVIAELLKTDVKVYCMTHSEEKIGNLPDGVTGRLGDLENHESLLDVFLGMDALFLLVALSQTETEQGLNAVKAAKNCGIKKIVYLSVPIPEDSIHIPHFKSKIPIEEAIKSSGINYTILRPNNFFQNDLWFKDAIVGYKVYPQPIGSLGQNRVDVRDIAEVAVKALTEPGHDNKDYEIHGPDELSGEKVAKIWSKYLGTPVNYAGDDLESWSEQAKAVMPGWMVDDLKIMYKYFQDKGFNASDTSLKDLREVLGHPPRSFDDFAEETLKLWTD